MMERLEVASTRITRVRVLVLLLLLVGGISASVVHAEENIDISGDLESLTPPESEDPEVEELEERADPDLVQPDTPPGEVPKPEYGGIEEITVTAKKRATNLQETPTAITALTGAQLFDRGIYDVEQLATQVPNFQYGETFGIARITIRGVGNQGFTDPSTAFHIDGVYQNNPTAASSLAFYDLSGIEVLRGPQGTLWGRNSTAGAINVSTRRPIHDFEVFGDMLFGSYNQYSGRGVVNVPVVEDRVASRVAFYFDKRDGFQENLWIPGNGQNADDADNWGVRPQLLFEMNDNTRLVVRGLYNHQGGVGFGNKIVGDYPDPYLFTPDGVDNPFAPPGSPDKLWIFVDPYTGDRDNNPNNDPVEPNPIDPRQIRRNTVQFQDISTWSINGTLEWDGTLPALGDVFFSAVGSYRYEDRLQNFDGDLTEQNIVDANIQGRTRDGVLDMYLRGAEDSSFQWTLGFFMLNADGYLNTGLPSLGGAARIFPGSGGKLCLAPSAPSLDCLGVQWDQTIELRGSVVGGSNETLSVAGYANLEQALFDDRLKIELGVRYSYDKSTADRYSTEVLSFSPATGLACLQPGVDTGTQSDNWSAITGTLKADYQIRDQNMVYGSVSKGYKPGYINGIAVGLGCEPPNTDPLPNALSETIWAFEAGSKNRFFDNTVQANVTGFYYLFSDYQVQTQALNTTFIQNATAARIWGLEFEGQWMPIDNLSLSLVYGYLNAKYTDYIGFNFATGQVEDFSGNTMIRAPEHQATIAGEYLFEIGKYGALIPRVQYIISDKIFFTAANTSDEAESWFGNLQFRLRWENIENTFFVEGFVENATGTNVRNNRSVGSAILGTPIYASFQPPRTWGIRIGGSY